MLHLAIKKNKSLFMSSCLSNRYFHINYLNNNDSGVKNNGTIDEEALVRVVNTFIDHARANRASNYDSKKKKEKHSTIQQGSANKTEGNYLFLNNPLSHKVYSGKQIFEKKELPRPLDTAQSDKAVNSRFHNLGNKQSDLFRSRPKFKNEKPFQINDKESNIIGIKPTVYTKPTVAVKLTGEKLSNREIKRQKYRNFQINKKQLNNVVVKSPIDTIPIGEKLSNREIKKQRYRNSQINKNQLNNVVVKSSIGTKTTIDAKPISGKPYNRMLEKKKDKYFQINKKQFDTVGVKSVVGTKHNGEKLSNRALKKQKYKEIEAAKNKVVFYVTQPISAIKNKKLLAKAANDKQVRFIKYTSRKQRITQRRKLKLNTSTRIQTYRTLLPLGHINDLLTPIGAPVKQFSFRSLNGRVRGFYNNKSSYCIPFTSKEQLANQLRIGTTSVLKYKKKQARLAQKYFDSSCVKRAFPTYLTGPGFGTLPYYLQTIKFEANYNSNQRLLGLALEYFRGTLGASLNLHINRYLSLLQELDISRLQSIAVRKHYINFFILFSKLSRLSNEVLNKKENLIFSYFDRSINKLQKLKKKTDYRFGTKLSNHLKVAFKKLTKEEILRRKALRIQRAKALYKKEQLKYLIGIEKKGGLPQVIDHKFGNSILYTRHLFKKKKKVISPHKKKLVLLLKYILFYLSLLSKYKITKNHFYLVSLLETRVTLLNLINSYLNLNISRLNFSLDLSAVIRSILTLYEKKLFLVRRNKKSSLVRKKKISSLFRTLRKKRSSLFQVHRKKRSSLFQVHGKKRSSLFQAYKKKIVSLSRTRRRKISSLFQIYRKRMLSLFLARKKKRSLLYQAYKKRMLSRYRKKKISSLFQAYKKRMLSRSHKETQSVDKKLVFRTYAALKKHKYNYYLNKQLKQKAFDYITGISAAKRDGIDVPIKANRIAYRIMLFMLCYHRNKAFILPSNDLLHKKQMSFKNRNFISILKLFLSIDSSFFKSYKKRESVLKIKNIISKSISDSVRMKAPYLDLSRETALSIKYKDALYYYQEMLKECQVLFYSTFKNRIGRKSRVAINPDLFASLISKFRIESYNDSNSEEPINVFDTEVIDRIREFGCKFGSLRSSGINEIINSAELATSSFDTIKFSAKQLASFSVKKVTRRLTQIQLHIAKKYIIKKPSLLIINKERISTASIYRMFGGKKPFFELIPYIFIFLYHYSIQNRLPKSLLFLLFRNHKFIRTLIKHSHITYKSDLNYVYRNVAAALYPRTVEASIVQPTVKKLRTLYYRACYTKLCKKYNISNPKLSKQEYSDRILLIKNELNRRTYELSLIADSDLHKYIVVGNRKLVDRFSTVKRAKYLKKNVPYNDFLTRLVYKKKLLTSFFRLSKKKNKYLSLFLSKRPHLAKYKNDFFIFKNIVNIKETAKLKRRRYFNYKYRELLLFKKEGFHEFLNNRYFDLRNMFNVCVSSILPKEYQETHTIIKRIKLDHVNKKKIRQKLNMSTSLYLKLKKVRSVLRKKLKQVLFRSPAHLFALNNYSTMFGNSTGVESKVSKLIRFIVAKQNNKKNIKKIKNQIVNTFLYRLSISKDQQALLVFIYLAFYNVLEKTVSSLKFTLSNDVILSRTNLSSVLFKLSDFFIYLNEKQFSFYSYPLLFSYYGFNKNLPFSNKLNPFFNEQTKRKLKPLNTLKYALCKTKLKKSSLIKKDYYSLLTVYNAIKQKNKLKALKLKKAIIYVRTTFTNVFIYFIYENKVICKKTIGELRGLKKKDRRFWRNVYPATTKVLRSFFMYLRQYHFDFVTVYVNGDSSLYSPVISSLSKHRRDIAYQYKGLIRRFKGHFKHSVTRRLYFGRKYILFDNIRHEIIDKCKRFKHISKYYFAVNKIKDITSWPFNGCKLRKNVR